MRNYIDIMVLLARMRFQLEDEDSYYASYEDLATAEQACEEFGYSAGYRWVSGAFYILGAAMANASMYASAIYPLRKACTLLEKSSSYAASETGRLHLSKRYEILGTCCRKDNRFEVNTIQSLHILFPLTRLLNKGCHQSLPIFIEEIARLQYPIVCAGSGQVGYPQSH